MNNKYKIFLSVGLVFSSIFAYANTAKAELPLIDLCVKNNGGVYVIGEGFNRSECKVQDNAYILSINPNGGLPGPQGPIGPMGDIGLTGPVGEVGAKGLTGEMGPVGPQGAPGIQGVRGETGSTGPQGIQGVQGNKGDTGEKGNQGDAGPQTLTGITNIVIKAATTNTKTLTVKCDASHPNVISGGWKGTNSTVQDNYPSDTNAWTVTLSGNKSDWSAYAICSK